jgi:hypothetical protein
MRRSSVGATGAAIVVLFASVGCSNTPSTGQADASPPGAATPEPSPTVAVTPSASTSPTPDPTPSTDPAVPVQADFDPARFSDSATITNGWLPLQPGRRWVTDGVTLEGGERIPHQITFTVTDLSKVISRVKTVVVWVEDINNGELVEREIAFYGQDDDGTVWYFGEHPEELEDGNVVAAPTWIAGLEDARPGIKMFADPTTHTQTYYQGWAPKVEWSDFGRLDEAGLEDCVTSGCFADVVRFAESSDGEEGIFQLKSYAKGVGEIRTGWRGEAESREELELKTTLTLSGARLADVRRMALDLEEHAYQISPQVYGRTEPMQ